MTLSKKCPSLLKGQTANCLILKKQRIELCAVPAFFLAGNPGTILFYFAVLPKPPARLQSRFPFSAIRYLTKIP